MRRVLHRVDARRLAGPYTTTDEDCQEVIYIDHDHLHMAGNVNPGPGSGYPEPIQ